MELSPTAKVILGMLSIGPESGYEIKALSDRSARFFWAASYGQIYPELRRLAEAGLIEGTEAPTGDRKRTVYRLTEAGEAALREWLGSPPEVLELRHEGMLQVFFADAMPAAGRAGRLREMRDQHLAKVELLREIERGVPDDAEARDSSQYLILRFGIEFNQWAADWCEARARERESEAAATESG